MNTDIKTSPKKLRSGSRKAAPQMQVMKHLVGTIILFFNELVLLVGRAEFVEYLPEATQGVLVQPIGNQGVLILGCDTVRGISRLDQARIWVGCAWELLHLSDG
jgi:hypothetical protein